MLYSGYFSFDETERSGQERHGHFTCVVQAGGPEFALQKFRKRIHTIKEDIKDPLFKDITAIYIEDIMEIIDKPEEAVVTRFQSSEGRFPKSVNYSLPTSDTDKIKAFQWLPEADAIEDRELDQGRAEYKVGEPFIVFN